MRETYVFVVAEGGKTVVSQGVLIDFVRDKINGQYTHALIKGLGDTHEELHPIDRLFYKTIGD